MHFIITFVEENLSIEKKHTAAKPVLTIEHLYKSFGSNHVLSDVNLNLYKSENVAVLGKSGSGKSVLIKCIIGLLKPDKGSIIALGKNIPDLSFQELDKVRRKVGFLFQSNALYDSMTVRENLEFPLRRHSINTSHQQVNEMVMEALKNVGLEKTVNMMPEELSGGMQKRIALARTLILKPEIILYDEPTTGLDPVTAKEIIELIIKMREKFNISALIISHDLSCIKMTSDRVVLLLDGKFYAEGKFQELQQMNDPKVKQFFE